MWEINTVPHILLQHIKEDNNKITNENKSSALYLQLKNKNNNNISDCDLYDCHTLIIN